MNWHIGGGWSRQFMDISGFDSIFCGRKIKSISASDYEDVYVDVHYKDSGIQIESNVPFKGMLILEQQNSSPI